MTTKDLELIREIILASRYTVYLDMTGATFPDNIVQEKAFEGCRKLDGIDLPASIVEIGLAAFGSCTGLTAVTIPAAVTKLGISAFNVCTALATLTFGASGQTTALNEIGQFCFAHCNNLKTVNYWGTETNWTSITKNDGYKTDVNLTTFKVSSDGSSLTDASAVSVF